MAANNKPQSNDDRYEPTLAEQIEVFVNDLKDANTASQIKRLWETEFDLYNHLKDTTKKLYTSKYRKAIRETLGEDHKSLKYVKIPADMSARIRSDYNQRTATENRELIEMTHWEELVGVSLDMVQHGSPLETGMGLLLLTGRRPFEVFCTANFYRSKIRNTKAWHKWQVRFSGQSKTRGAQNSRSGATYKIPVLAPAPTILDAHDRMQASEDGQRWINQDNEAFSKELRSILRLNMFKYFGGFWPAEADLTPYCMRALYAEIAYSHFAPDELSKAAYFAKILGHQTSDINTSLSYMDYYLPGKIRSASREINRLQKRSVRLAKARGEDWED